MTAFWLKHVAVQDSNRIMKSTLLVICEKVCSNAHVHASHHLCTVRVQATGLQGIQISRIACARTDLTF